MPLKNCCTPQYFFYSRLYLDWFFFDLLASKAYSNVIVKVTTEVFRGAGVFFLINAFWAAHYVVRWLSDVLWVRWSRRDRKE